MADRSSQIFGCLKKVEEWVWNRDYKGYEPFDGLSSSFRPLAFGNLFLDRLLLQLVRQSPINLRPLLGVKPLDSTIGRGYMAWGYCHLFSLTGDETYRSKLSACLDWLIANKSPGYPDYSWGKHFDFASRGGMYRAFEPILIWTALIQHAFLEAYELFGETQYLEVAQSACEWILKLPRKKTDSGACLGYHPRDMHANIHNSNMIGAAVLARTAKHTRRADYLEVAREAMRFSCSRQLPDGAWLYGEHPQNHWIDNFHTGYNLDGLKCYMEYSGDREFEKELKAGLKFYKKNFFEKSGRPKYYHNQAYPIDSQCAAQSIDTLANFAEHDDEARQLAFRVASWTIDHMFDQKGYFYFRKYPMGITARTPMLHWSQAVTYKALAFLLMKTQA